MGPARHLRFAVAALLLAAAVVPAAIAQEETEHEEEFNYVRGDEHGPEHWGSIKPEWAACGVGRMQSPIDLSHRRVSQVPSLGYLDHSYRPAKASIVNLGHYVMVRFEGDAGRLEINGTAYYLKQMHWHSPTEHAIDGRRYDLELHLVHESAEKKVAVIGILYKIGAGRDALLHKLEPFIRRITDQRDMKERVGMVDTSMALGRVSVYFRYMGSLTTPPCTEGVIWTVVERVRTVSRHQLELLREAVHYNARPLQEANNRDISIFRACPINSIRSHFKLHPFLSDVWADVETLVVQTI